MSRITFISVVANAQFSLHKKKKDLLNLFSFRIFNFKNPYIFKTKMR